LKKKNLLALTEEWVIFAHIIKWVTLATIIGAIVGAAIALFLKILHSGIDESSKYPFYFLLLPLALFLNIIISKYLLPDAQGHGTEKVIEAVHKHSGYIKPLVVPVKAVSTLITIISGGSVGKEGPSAQIGAGLASMFSNIFRFDKEDRKKLVICGISAGFSAVFGTPIAGAIFGVEVLVVGNVLYDVLLPSFVAGMISHQVATSLGIEYAYFPILVDMGFNIPIYLEILLAGLFFGAVSFIFIEGMKWTEKLVEKIKVWAPLKGIIGGLLLIGLTFIFSTDYLGLGLPTIEKSLTGFHIIWYAFLVKILFTWITLSFGGSGGIVTPIFFIGATAGIFFSNIVGGNSTFFAGLGFVSLLAGTANTPIAAIIMAMELFGPSILPYATITCVTCFLFTGHRSAFPSQKLGINKASSIMAETGHELDHDHDTHFKYKTRRRMITGLHVAKFFKIYEFFNRKNNNKKK
jgi:H+/Cl- antiporter ClcA